jgi:hypothetical protein
MAYDPGMIQPKRKQPAAPEIETDLLGIQQLSQEQDDENWGPGSNRTPPITSMASSKR